MVPSFLISIDKSRALLRLTLTGFFDLETVARFKAERNRAVEELACGRNRHVTLCDISEQKVSTLKVSEEFRRVLTDPRYSSRQLAFVVKGTLEKLSIRRVADRPNVAFFGDVAAAEAWLFDTTTPAAAIAATTTGVPVQGSIDISLRPF